MVEFLFRKRFIMLLPAILIAGCFLGCAATTASPVLKDADSGQAGTYFYDKICIGDFRSGTPGNDDYRIGRRARLGRPAQDIVREVVKQEFIRKGYTLRRCEYTINGTVKVLFPWINPPALSISYSLMNTSSGSVMFEKEYMENIIRDGDEFVSAAQRFSAEFLKDVSPVLAAYDTTMPAPIAEAPPSVAEKQGDDAEPGVDVDVDIPHTAMKNPNAVAVIIGNSTYKNPDIPKMKYAQNDAETMKKYLVDALGFSESNIIFRKDATKAEFEGIFGIRGLPEGELSDLIKPDKSDVFIYYSGHGAPDTNTFKGYFIPSDCSSSKYAITGYALDLFYENLSRLPARSITVVIDACFSGSTSSGETLIESASPCGVKIDNPAVGKGNTVCLTSSRGDQISSWYNEKRHGLFTYFFLKAISENAHKQGKEALTFQELYNYVNDISEGVPYWAKRLYHGRKQNPTIQGTDLDRVFVRY